MSRRCVLRGALVHDCCQNSVIAAPRPLQAHALFPTSHTGLLSSAILPVRYRIYVLLEPVATQQMYTVIDGAL